MQVIQVARTYNIAVGPMDVTDCEMNDRLQSRASITITLGVKWSETARKRSAPRPAPARRMAESGALHLASDMPICSYLKTSIGMNSNHTVHRSSAKHSLGSS